MEHSRIVDNIFNEGEDEFMRVNSTDGASPFGFFFLVFCLVACLFIFNINPEKLGERRQLIEVMKGSSI